MLLRALRLRAQIFSSLTSIRTPTASKRLLQPTVKSAKNPIISLTFTARFSQSARVMSDTNGDSSKKEKKTYHTKASGEALQTVERRAKDHELKLYGSCFCPFVQRVWISLEFKGLDYQYIEVDPYKKPKELLDVNPRGLIPALKHGDWGCYESTVLMEYVRLPLPNHQVTTTCTNRNNNHQLEDLNTTTSSLLPSDPKLRAHSRLWSDHVNRHIVPSFYHVLQAQDPQKQSSNASTLRDHIATLVNAADPTGPFFLGKDMSFVDVQAAPWILRLKKVLGPYRGWPEPEPESRWGRWVSAVEKAECVRATTSEDKMYLDSYERYAENRPDTSQVAKAVNEGRGLP